MIKNNLHITFCLLLSHLTYHKNVAGFVDDNIQVHLPTEGSDIIVSEGEQVILPCKTNFLSDSLISWYKDDNKIAENLTYSFRLRFATREDAGYYHCIVKTAYGGVRSRKIKLEVGYLDPPSDVKLRSFIEVTLGQAIVIWPGSVQTEQQKQSFPTDGGREPWKPPLNSINETRKTTLSTYYLQAVPFPQAIWTINNAPLPNTLNIFVSQLEQAIVLLNIDREMDSKVIRARLVNGYGNANDGVFSQTHIIQVKDPPVNMAMHSLDLVLPPKDASLVLKDDHPGMAIFECVFNARPAHALKVQWFKRRLDGKRELINPTAIVQSQLKATNQQQQIGDQPIYKFDSSGLNRTLIISNIFPSIIPSNYPQQTAQNSIYSEEYTCHAYLNGYNSNSLFEMNNFLLEESEFTSSSLLSSTSNLYRSISPISTTARLKLYLPPKIHFPPDINMNSSTVQLEVLPRQSKLIIIETSASMDIKLPCELDRYGIPAADIKWLRNGELISIFNEERYCIQSNNTLIIKSLKLTDAGIFQCYAYNGAGEDFLNIWLKVTSFAPRLCNSETNVSNFTVLEGSSTVLICPIHGAPTPVFKWYRETEENKWAPIHQLYQNNKFINDSSITQSHDARKYRKSNDMAAKDMFVMMNKQRQLNQVSDLCVHFGQNELKIDHINYESTGQYKCEATNYLGNETAFIHVNVYARTTPVHHLPSSITVLANQSLSITCSFYVDQHAVAEINWFQGRKESNIRVSTNEINSDERLYNKKTRRNASSNLNNGASIDPVITYFTHQVPNINQRFNNLKEYGSILHVSSVHSSHQGFYACEIISPGGNYTLKTELKVVSLPMMPVDLSVSSEFPHEEYGHHNSSSVQLSWIQPQPTYQLKITHYAIYIHKLHSQFTSAKKKCERIEDNEWQLLSAINFLGWSKKSYPVFYSVSNTPKVILEDITITLYLVNVTDTCIEIIWLTTLNTNKVSLASIKEYQLYHWIENTDSVAMKKISNVKHFVNQDELVGLRSMTQYNLKIAACNEFGCGKYSEVLRVQTKQQPLTKIPSHLSVIVHQTNEVEISFPSDYLNEDEYFIEGVEGFLIKLNCIDPPGCFGSHLFLPLKCVGKGNVDTRSTLSVNGIGINDSFLCNEINLHGNFSFIRRRKKNNHHVVIILKLLNAYTLYEMHIAYVYSNQIGPFSEPAEVFRTHEDVPSRIPNVLVNSDGLDGLLVEWDAPEQPNGQILQYILHYNEVKPTDWLANNEPSDHQEFSFLKNTYRTQNKNDISASIQDYYLNSSQSIERHLYQMKHLSSSASRNSDLISSPHSQMYDNRKYAGYYSLNRTTYRIHIESLISHHVYQIRMFALNTAGLSPVTLQLGFTSSSISVTRGKENYPLSDKQFLQWVNLIHFGKHEQKIFKWLNGTSIGFIKVPDIVTVNGHDAEVSTELEITSENVYFLTNNKNQLFYSNESYRAANDLLQIIKLIEQSKWA
ncbi:unnamed protein product [Heterobilharzia americana]|nr:unnamed protein product [Heterobilharzia americana]